jgi:hypothetical protein
MKQSLASNDDFAGSPVDVIELESHHFTGAEAETGKQKKDGVVAAAGRGATVAGFEQTFDFLRTQVLGHGGQPPISYRWYRSGHCGLVIPPAETGTGRKRKAVVSATYRCLKD